MLRIDDLDDGARRHPRMLAAPPFRHEKTPQW
jgi:hypothetical protein